MAESNANLTHDQEMDVESHAPYMKVFGALLIFTLLEYFYAKIMAASSLTTLIGGLMTMAIIKAALVGIYFMHLKFEGKWVYGMLVPAGILAVILTVALIPDVSMQPVTEENPDVEDMPMEPIQPGAQSSISWTRSILA